MDFSRWMQKIVYGWDGAGAATSRCVIPRQGAKIARLRCGVIIQRAWIGVVKPCKESMLRLVLGWVYPASDRGHLRAPYPLEMTAQIEDFS